MKQELKQQFIDALYEVYPDCQVHGTVTRKQIDDVMQKKGIIKYPSWLTYSHARVERGVFSIAAALGTAPRANPAPVAKPTSTVVHIHSHQSAHEDSLIPQLDPNYVPFGNYKDTEAIIKSKMFYPVYITGPSGNGKTAMVEQLCAKHKRPLIRINMTSMADEEMLIGSKTLINGNIEVIDGPVIKAMRMGAILLIDEIDAANPNSALCLQAVLEKGRYYFKLKDEMVIAAPGFNVFATANTNRNYLSSLELNGIGQIDDLVIDDYNSMLYRRILTSAGPHGRVSPAGELMVPVGGSTNIAVLPDAYYKVGSLQVDGEAVAPAPSYTFLNVTEEHALSAGFAEKLTVSGVPEVWLNRVNPAWTDNFNLHERVDLDGDGVSTGDEYAMGTDATNSRSVFKLGLGVSDGQPVVSFQTVPEGGFYGVGGVRRYGLFATDDLLSGDWQGVPGFTNVVGAGQPVIYTNQVNEAGRRFFRGRVWLEQ